MDRYHSIVEPMVSYHWKTIVSNGCPTSKPSASMVAGPKTIAKPLVPMVCQTKNHCKTTDTNGCYPTLHLLPNPSLFGIFFAERGQASWSLINNAFYSPHLSHPKPKYKINCDHWKTIGGNGSTVKKTLEKLSIPMVKIWRKKPSATMVHF